MWSHENSNWIKTVKGPDKSKSLSNMIHMLKLQRLSLKEQYYFSTELFMSFLFISEFHLCVLGVCEVIEQ